MINVTVWSDKVVDVEGKGEFSINQRMDLVNIIKAILDQAFYSGETICLEIADVSTVKGKAEFSEIERWR